MAEYIERKALLERIRTDTAPFNVAIVFRHIHNMPAADVAPVVHGTPVLRYRPERHEWYEATGLNENGEPLYVKRVRIDEKSWAMYCPACGKRLCSRFNNYCPNCGAKMDGGNGK